MLLILIRLGTLEMLASSELVTCLTHPSSTSSSSSHSWINLNGRPTFCILISEKDMRDPQFGSMLNFLAQLRQGHCEGVKVRLGRLQNLLSSSCIEHLDFLSGKQNFTSTVDNSRLEKHKTPKKLQ